MISTDLCHCLSHAAPQFEGAQLTEHGEGEGGHVQDCRFKGLEGGGEGGWLKARDGAERFGGVRRGGGEEGELS